MDMSNKLRLVQMIRDLEFNLNTLEIEREGGKRDEDDSDFEDATSDDNN